MHEELEFVFFWYTIDAHAPIIAEWCKQPRIDITPFGTVDRVFMLVIGLEQTIGNPVEIFEWTYFMSNKYLTCQKNTYKLSLSECSFATSEPALQWRERFRIISKSLIIIRESVMGIRVWNTYLNCWELTLAAHVKWTLQSLLLERISWSSSFFFFLSPCISTAGRRPPLAPST